MQGKLAKAYAGLMKELHSESQSAPSVKPWDFKKTLGTKISRFSGYNQQDSSELVNFLLDLLHEDLNRVKKKPYHEMSENPNRSEAEVAQEFWENFTARNKSIIVDLMYGQLKSTVTCLTCGKIAITFDPYLSIQLPIAEPPVKMRFNIIPCQMFEYDEETKGYSQKISPVAEIVVEKKTSILDIKRELATIPETEELKPSELFVC